IIVSFGDKLTMQETLEESLAVVFGAEVPEIAPPQIEVPGEEKTTEDLITEALVHYQRAQEHLKEGNWSAYGEDLDKLEAILVELNP
ncbi:MAG: hypothetical protein V3V36_03370, partial [Candidatus Hydrothermarchaeaceae archaeon]